MLVLGRQKNQSIMIGDDIEIVIVMVKSSGVVSVGVKAPPHMPIHRTEVYKKMIAEGPLRTLAKNLRQD